MGFASDLVDFSREFSNSGNSKTAINFVKLSILDWAAVGILGKLEPASNVIMQMVSEESGREEAFVFGSQVKYPARAAALANGVISHALDYDDTNFKYLGHPSVVVNSAVFAIANKINLPLSSTIECVLVGSEVASRMGVWLGKDHYDRGFHITATAGVFGAAMGSSRVLGSTKNIVKNALSLASSKASGLKMQFGTMGKPYHAGIAASSGVEVAILASYGLTAAEYSLEGEYGFGSVYGRPKGVSNLSFEKTDFLSTQTKFKFHACCHGTHASIEALEFLKINYCLDVEKIYKIIITVHPSFATVCNIHKPKSGLEMKFSYRMIAALQMFGYDTGKFETFADHMCLDRALNEFTKKIDVYFTEQVGVSQSYVEVQLISGQTYSKSYDLSDEVTYNRLESRVRKKVQNLLGKSIEEKIWMMIQDEEVSSTTFMKFLSEC